MFRKALIWALIALFSWSGVATAQTSLTRPSPANWGSMTRSGDGGGTSSLRLNFAGGNYTNTGGYVRANYFLNAAAPITQTITLPVGSYFTNITGSGSAAVAAGTATITGAGSATAAAYLNFSVTVAGTVTVTIAGGPSTVHVGNGHYPSTFINTGATAVSVTTYASSNPADVGDLVYTRSGPAYAPDSAGNLVAFADGVIRITSKGYWAEETRTNAYLYSTDLTNAAWAKSVSVTPGQTDLNGGATAFLVTADGVSLSFIKQNPTIITGLTTSSVIAKAGTSSTLLVEQWGGITSTPASFNLATGVATNGTNVAAKMTPFNGGWYLCEVTGTTTVANLSPAWYIDVYGVATAGKSLYLWLPQNELGGNASTRIPTTSAAVTRAADVGYYTIPSLSTSYTLAAVGSSASASGTYPTLVQLDSGSDANRALLYGNVSASTTVGGARVDFGSVTQSDSGSGSAFTNGTPFGVALSVQASRMARSTNGNPVNAGSGTVPTVNTLRLGVSQFSGNLNGPLAKTAVWSSALNDNETIYRSAGNF